MALLYGVALTITRKFNIIKIRIEIMSGQKLLRKEQSDKLVKAKSLKIGMNT